MRLRDGSHVEVLQYVTVTLDRNVGDPFQPENWLIHRAGAWLDFTKTCPAISLSELEETPPDLWQQPGAAKSDRVSHQWLESFPPTQSLYMIRPKSFQVHVGYNPWKEKTNWRAHFRYNGATYSNLSITDPAFQYKYSTRVQSQQLPPDFSLPCGDRCLLCVSLGGAFNGEHYKLVATVFEDVP